MTIVTIEDYDTTVAKYDRFATKAIPKKGKLRAAYGAVKLGSKIFAGWAKTPADRRAIWYYARHSKYTKYGTTAVAGGIIWNALRSAENGSTLEIRQTRSDMVRFSNRRKLSSRKNACIRRPVC